MTSRRAVSASAAARLRSSSASWSRNWRDRMSAALGAFGRCCRYECSGWSCMGKPSQLRRQHALSAVWKRLAIHAWRGPRIAEFAGRIECFARRSTDRFPLRKPCRVMVRHHFHMPRYRQARAGRVASCTFARFIRPITAGSMSACAMTHRINPVGHSSRFRPRWPGCASMRWPGHGLPAPKHRLSRSVPASAAKDHPRAAPPDIFP